MVVLVYNTGYIFGTFTCGTQCSAFVQDRIRLITRLHVEHIGSACLKYRAYVLERSNVTNNFVD